MSKRPTFPFASMRQGYDASPCFAGRRLPAAAIRNDCLGLHVRRAARALARRYDDALRPFALTGGQFSLLMALDRPTPATMGAVARTLGMDRTTLTANLKPLVARGVIAVAADPADRRARRLALTGAGRALLAAALPIWRQAESAAERLLAGSDVDRLRRDLRALA